MPKTPKKTYHIRFQVIQHSDTLNAEVVDKDHEALLFDFGNEQNAQSRFKALYDMADSLGMLSARNWDPE